jgi:Lar family restriction alleviation protein
MNKLKPCPFCGGEAKIKTGEEGNNYAGWVFEYAICIECESMGKKISKSLKSKEQAINAWNARANASTDPSITSAEELEVYIKTPESKEQQKKAKQSLLDLAERLQNGEFDDELPIGRDDDSCTDVFIGMNREEAEMLFFEKYNKKLPWSAEFREDVRTFLNEIYTSIEPKNVVARYVYNNSIMELIRDITSDISPLRHNGKIYTLTIQEEKDG